MQRKFHRGEVNRIIVDEAELDEAMERFFGRSRVIGLNGDDVRHLSFGGKHLVPDIEHLIFGLEHLIYEREQLIFLCLWAGEVVEVEE